MGGSNFCDRLFDLRKHLAGEQQMGLDDDASKRRRSGPAQAFRQIGLGDGGEADFGSAHRRLLSAQLAKRRISASASG